MAKVGSVTAQGKLEAKVADLEAELRTAKRREKALRADLERVTASSEAARQAKAPKLAPRKIGRKRSRTDILRVVIPDTHGSGLHRPAAQAFLADLKRLDPDEIVMLGDHVDCGGFLAAHHTLGYVAQTEYSYEEDIEHANQFLDAVQKAAPRASIHMLEGNHERRVETWCVTSSLRHGPDAEFLRRQLAPEFMLRLKERGIRYYRQAECHMDLRVQGTIVLGKCYFWHGTSSADNAAKVNASQIGGNVVFGHTHRQQSWPTRNVAQGDHGSFNPGCLCKLQPLWRHTSPTKWTHGYHFQHVNQRSGRFFPVNVPIIDGESLLWTKG
jgi:predicted phosphodiesterase